MGWGGGGGGEGGKEEKETDELAIVPSRPKPRMVSERVVARTSTLRCVIDRTRR